MKTIFKTVLLIGVLIIGITAVSGINDILNKGNIVSQELKKNEIESYKTTHFKDNKVFIRVHPEISDGSTLTKYVNQRTATLKYLSNTHGDTIVDAVITFNDKYPMEAYRSFMNSYGLEELSYMYNSYPEGMGVLSNETPTKLIKQTEENIGRNYTDFKLIDKIVSVKTRIHAKDLLRIQSDKRVFLVDAGPEDVYRENSNKEIRTTIDYIYPVYIKFGR